MSDIEKWWQSIPVPERTRSRIYDPFKEPSYFSVKAWDHQQKKIDQLTKENERLKKELMLEKAVVEKVTDLRPSRYSGEYEANDVNLVMGSARTRITERKEL